jgi:hypothetical protein
MIGEYMGHYAKVENGIVTTVIVAQKDFIDTLPDKDHWVKTSYNTYGGKHLLGKEPLRKNYAGIGYYYDPKRDAFIPPMPDEEGTWVLNETTCLWEKED